MELLPLFAEMLGRFCLNRARQSDHENLGRHFRLGADYDRIRDLFGCSVYALGILSPRARSCDNGCRPCAQTRLGAKVTREGSPMVTTHSAIAKSSIYIAGIDVPEVL